MLTVSPEPQFSERVHDWPAFALLDEPGVRSLNAFFYELTSTRELHDALRLVSEQVRSYLGARFVAVMIFEHGAREQFADAAESGTVSLPLATAERTIGQITIYLHHSSQLSETETKVMEVICAIAAVTLDNACRLQRDRKRLHQAEAVASLVPALIASQSTEEAARLVATTLRDKLHYDIVRVLWSQSRRGEIKSLAAALPAGSASDIEQSCEELGAARRVFRDGSPVLIGDLSSEDCRTKPRGLRSLLCVPIFHEQAVVGALDVAARSPRAFDSTDLATLQSLAATLSSVMERLVHGKPDLRGATSEQNIARTDLISAIVHDLRGPLSLVKGYASTLLRRGEAIDEDKRKRFVSGIGEAADRMADMVDELSRLSRLSSGRFRPKLQQVDIVNLVGETVERQRAAIGQHAITLELPGESLLIEADPVHLGQALGFLLTNAGSRSPIHGRIVVRVGGRRALAKSCVAPLADEPAPSWAVVEVADEGSSIPQGQLDMILEKSYRANCGDGRNRGLGLELVAAKKIVEAHGGSMWVESGLARGSAFCFGVPLRATGQGRL